MPFSNGYPFKRINVDHMIRGVTRVWWELDPRFKDAGPYVYQLQVGFAGTGGATDWRDVGSPLTDATYADDDQQRLFGQQLLTHYRVKVTTADNVFVSAPQNVYGYLAPRDWTQAREIIRKERLRLGVVSSDGYLLKRRRFGAKCTRCRDELTDNLLDSDCPLCHGTGYEGGYHPPVPFAVDAPGDSIIELRNGGTPPGQSREDVGKVRAIASPIVAREDIWVSDGTDERFSVGRIDCVAAVRGVPVIVEIELELLPYTHHAYQLEVGGEPAEREDPELPNSGSGCVVVTHDYGGEDELAYATTDGCGIPGATVKAYTQDDYDAERRGEQYVVAQTTTTANGRWVYALKLDPGDYVLVYEKTGEYGPDTLTLHVNNPVSSSSSAPSAPPSESSYLSSSFGL